jgi:hypothetical protein
LTVPVNVFFMLVAVPSPWGWTGCHITPRTFHNIDKDLVNYVLEAWSNGPPPAEIGMGCEIKIPPGYKVVSFKKENSTSTWVAF